MVAAIVALTSWVVTRRPGLLIEDNHYQFWSNPEVSLSRAFTVWDPTRGVGRAYPDFAPFPHLVTWVLRWVSDEPWVVQRLWLAVLLVTGGTGVHLLMRRLAPGTPWASLVAAVLYAFGPYSLGFLTPSWLYLHYALTPLLVWTVLTGVTSSAPWRWAAIGAFVLLLPGTVNIASMMLTASALIPFLAVAVASGAVAPRRLVRFGLALGAVSALLAAPVLVRTRAGASFLVMLLESTETVTDIARTSSWSESIRGLGGWILYWGPGNSLLRPDVESLVSQPLLVLATFVAPAVAVATIAFTTWPPRWMFAATLVWSTALMVGVYPVDDPSPLGDLLLRGYEGSLTFFGMRSTYKAGAGQQLAIAALTGVGLVAVGRQLRSPSRGRRALATGVLVVASAAILAATSPMWTGSLFDRDRAADGVPEYYGEAITWLDAQPGDERVLILPGSTEERFRWGSPSFDFFDPLLDRAYVLRLTIQYQTPPADDIVGALYEAIYSGEDEGRFLRPALERLGIEYVLVRHDVFWEGEQTVRPARLSWLSTHPDLVLAASFGDVGQHVVDPADPSPEAAFERQLPPIQIYRLRGESTVARSTSDVESIVVAGGGDAWIDLASSGEFESGLPVAFTGWLDADQLADELSRGSDLLITDTNRRFQELYGAVRSETLTADDDRRAIYDPYERPGSQTVVEFEGVESLREAPTTKGFGHTPAERPAAAFDGDSRTGWLTGASISPRGHRLRVTLPAPRRIGTIELEGFVPADPARRRLAEVIVRTDSGAQLTVALPGPGDEETTATARIDDDVEWIEFVVARTVGLGADPVGLSEIRIEPLLIREVIRVPDDVARLAEDDPRLADLLETTAISYRFERQVHRSTPVESHLDRRFHVPGQRSFVLEAEIELRTGVSDDQLAAMLDTDIRVASSGRLDGDPLHAAIWAVDGRYDTSWVTAGDTATIEIAHASGPASTIDLAFDRSTYPDLPAAVVLRIGEITRRIEIPEAEACSNPWCIERVRLDLGLPVSGPLELTLEPGAGGVAAFELAEIQVNGRRNPTAQLVPDCVSGLLELDDEPVTVRLPAELGVLRSGGSLPVIGCEPIELAPGWHDIEDVPGIAADQLVLEPADGRVGPDHVATSHAVGRDDLGPEHTRLRLTDTEPQIVTTGTSFDAQWQAVTASGQALEPVPYDGMTAYRVPADAGSVDVRIDRGGLPIALAAFTAGIVLTIVAIATTRRSPVAAPPTTAGSRSQASRAALIGACLVACHLLAGPMATIFAGLMLALARRHPGAVRLALLVAATALVVLAALASVPPLGPTTVVTSSYADLRPLANAFVRTAAVLIVIAPFTALASQRRATESAFTGRQRVETSRE